jgi:hypothetical protein
MAGMPSPEGKSPPRGSIGLALLALLVLSLVVAWRVPIPEKVPTVAWNSGWVFRAETFLGFFIGVYVLAAIVTTTIRTGRPPGKLSFGMVSYEEADEKTADALNESKVALQAVQREVDELRKRMEGVTSSARAAHEGLLALAGDDPHTRGVSEQARLQLAVLPREEEEAMRGGEAEYERAMGRLEQTLRELDQMLERPRRVRRAG